MRVTDEIQRRCLGRRHENRALRRIEVLNGHLCEALPRQKGNAHRPALDRPAVRCKEDLEFLWPLMRGTVILRGGEKARVVGEVEALHQRRDKLVGRKTGERAVFRRHDDVKTSRRRSDHLLLCETVKGELGGGGGNAQRRLHFARG